MKKYKKTTIMNNIVDKTPFWIIISVLLIVLAAILFFSYENESASHSHFDCDQYDESCLKEENCNLGVSHEYIENCPHYCHGFAMIRLPDKLLAQPYYDYKKLTKNISCKNLINDSDMIETFGIEYLTELFETEPDLNQTNKTCTLEIEGSHTCQPGIIT